MFRKFTENLDEIAFTLFGRNLKFRNDDLLKVKKAPWRDKQLPDARPDFIELEVDARLEMQDDRVVREIAGYLLFDSDYCRRRRDLQECGSFSMAAQTGERISSR